MSEQVGKVSGAALQDLGNDRHQLLIVIFIGAVRKQVLQKHTLNTSIQSSRPPAGGSASNFRLHHHPLNGPLSWTTQVSQYQKGKPIWILLKQETVSGSGISWAVCKSAHRSRQITMPVPHHSVFYRPDALPATQPTASKH